MHKMFEKMGIGENDGEVLLKKYLPKPHLKTFKTISQAFVGCRFGLLNDST